MADELCPGRKLARHRGALLAGQEPRRRLPLVIPGRRSARGRRARHAECRAISPKRWAVTAFRAPGSATVRSAPLSIGRVAPPDNELVIVSRALWSAGTRAHVPVALPRNARERSSSLKARALYITPLCTPAPRDHGSWLRRGPAGRPAAHEMAWHSPRSTSTAGGEARARPTPRRNRTASTTMRHNASRGIEWAPSDFKSGRSTWATTRS
jgi:hypothetical protein